MNKIIVLIYIIAIFCFGISILKTKDILYNIAHDIDSDIFIEIGNKSYNKEKTIEYYKVAIRYLIYFIYFTDIENLETVMA